MKKLIILVGICLLATTVNAGECSLTGSLEDCDACMVEMENEQMSVQKAGTFCHLAVGCYELNKECEKAKSTAKICEDKWLEGEFYAHAMETYILVGKKCKDMDVCEKAVSLGKEGLEHSYSKDWLADSETTGIYRNMIEAYTECINDMDKSCEWCNKWNEDRKADGKKLKNCDKYCGGSQESPSGVSGGETPSDKSGEESGELPIIPIAVGAVMLIVVAVGYFSMKKNR